MQLYIDTNTGKNIFILIKITGVTDALLQNAITIDEAQQIIFSPYYSGIFKNGEVANEIIEIIESGFELEDIKTVSPNLLNTEILRIKDSASKILASIKNPEVIERRLIEK